MKGDAFTEFVRTMGGTVVHRGTDIVDLIKRSRGCDRIWNAIEDFSFPEPSWVVVDVGGTNSSEVRLSPRLFEELMKMAKWVEAEEL